MLFSCTDDFDFGPSRASSRSGSDVNVAVEAAAERERELYRSVRKRADIIAASVLSSEAKEANSPSGAIKALRLGGRALPARWYLTPYLTCKECNAVSFVDSHKMQPLVEGSSEWSGAYGDVWGEWLPACSKCSATHAFVLGAREFSASIAEARLGLEHVIVAQSRMATRMQCIARGHVSRVALKARLAAEAAALAELSRRSETLQRAYRMCRSRLHLTALRNLNRINRAHRNVLYLALRPNTKLWGTERVFWYRRRAELALVFDDYRVLVQRQGHIPPMKRVRNNFQNLHDRIHHFEGRYATTIQKVVRGIEGRKHILIYRLCLAQLLGIHCTASMAIQRICRGWRGRRDAIRASDTRMLEKYRRSYLDERRVGLKGKAEKATRERVLGRYKQERALEFSARATGKTAFGADGGRKLRAFGKSVYGPVAAAQTELAVAQHIGVQKHDMARIRKDELDGEARERFVRSMRDGSAPQCKADGDRSPRSQKRIAGLKKWYFEEEFRDSQDTMFKRLGLYDQGCQYLTLQAGGARAKKVHANAAARSTESGGPRGGGRVGENAGKSGEGDVDVAETSWSGSDDDDYGEWVDDVAVAAAAAAAAAIEEQLKAALALELEQKRRAMVGLDVEDVQPSVAE